MKVSTKIKTRLNSVLSSDKSASSRINFAFKKDIENVINSYLKLTEKPLVLIETNELGEVVLTLKASGSFIK